MVALALSPDRAAADAARQDLRGVRLWLLFLILLVFAMVLVGGATRLTESGLSITQWNLFVGALPPRSNADWQAAFDLYRRSPQYDLLNQGMSLEAFRTIYWWEWAHRELGRFIGVVYVAGFLWFAMRRAVRRRVLAILAGMGLLLGAQGVVGWIMVASGLQPGMSAVEPLKLALHLSLASLFFAALVVMYVRLGGAEIEASARRSGIFAARALVLLVLLQIALGGLVAGHDAGLTYNTWPLMDGRLIPDGLATLKPLWLNAFDNIVTIQFNHRLGAYLLAAAIPSYAVAMRRAGPAARARAVLLVALVLLQLAVGIATLINVVPMGLALVHQGVALILLLALVWNASVVRAA